jgi:uncharacterized membrane protein YkoI
MSFRAVRLSEVLAHVQPQLGGEIVGVAFQRDHQRWVYEFRLVTPDGGIGRVLVDAKSGDIINRETR